MLFSYKKNKKIKRKELLLSFYDIFDGKEELEKNESTNNEPIEFRENILTESINFLLNDSTDVSMKNQSLDSIAQLTKISYEDVFSFIDPTIFQEIIEQIYHQETCSNAFYVLCLFTYYTDGFNDLLVESDLFNFISDAIPELDELQFNRCIILLINLFITISLEKPFEVNLLQNLLNIEISKISQFPNLISLYSIIVSDEELPIEYIQKVLRIYKEILSQNPKISKNDDEFSMTEKLLKSKKKVFEYLDLFLNPENKILSSITMHFINNNNIIKHIYDEMNIFYQGDEIDEFYKRNESNKIHCLSILTQMLKDDSFFPQLTVFDFDKEFVQLCQDDNENIQFKAIDSSVAFIIAFPDFALKFVEFDFVDIFISASFQIKASLNVLYNHVLPLIIDKYNDFELVLSKFFIDVVLDMTDSGNEFVKMNVYELLTLFVVNNLNFVFDFNIVEECKSHGIFDMIKDDVLSENNELAEWANEFLLAVKGNKNQQEDEFKEECF